jgi:CubicO group peptidase (beta-lactamase class C family)
MRLSSLVFILSLVIAHLSPLDAQGRRLDSLDAYVTEQMEIRHIAGLSLAVIQDGRIVVARGYGVADKNTGARVTPATLFQAGSISKPVSALGALHLVEAGRLSLDDNVNDVLKSWHVADNEFTTSERVTLRRILSHSAGLTVHGFPGYDVADRVPSLIQILDGAPPANTPAIRVDITPGSIWRYSGGGFTVMQQMIIDLTGESFPDYMQQTVLRPIGMTSSSFQQPLPPERAALAASGYYADQTPVRGRWHIYPEMAAAGLWTTPTDLARFAIEVREAFSGRGHGIVSPEMARQYLTVQKRPSGLGIIVQGEGKTLSYNHGGRDEGFDARLFAYAESGAGVVIMINANDNSHFMNRIQQFIGRSWGWPVSESAPVAVRGKHIESRILARYAGYYELHENQMIMLVPNADSTGLETLVDGLPDQRFFALDSIRFGSSDEGLRITFAVDSLGVTTGAHWGSVGDREDGVVPRVVPLPSAQTPIADPDPKLTGKITAALHALHAGGEALASAPNITAGAKKDFAGWGGHDLDGMGTLSYIGEEDVSGRGIHRHGVTVASVRYYRFRTNAGTRYVLVHLAPEGNVTDIDVVEK